MRLHCVSSRLPNSSGLCISRLLCRTSRLLCAISLLLCAISLLLCTISLLLCTRPSPSHLQLRFWPHSNCQASVIQSPRRTEAWRQKLYGKDPGGCHLRRAEPSQEAHLPTWGNPFI